MGGDSKAYTFFSNIKIFEEWKKKRIQKWTKVDRRPTIGPSPPFLIVKANSFFLHQDREPFILIRNSESADSKDRNITRNCIFIWGNRIEGRMMTFSDLFLKFELQNLLIQKCWIKVKYQYHPILKHVSQYFVHGIMKIEKVRV